MSKPEGERYTVAVDFDGVLHSYTSPWVDAATIPDPPVPGAIEWLLDMIRHFDVAILSTRNHQDGGAEAMRAWLRRHVIASGVGTPGDRSVEDVSFPLTKPAALVYVDDRAWRFEGRFPTKDEIHAARPWNKRPSAITNEGPELSRVEVVIDDQVVRVTKLPDDPVCLRASLGGTAEAGFYCSYRGDARSVLHMLHRATAALTATVAAAAAMDDGAPSH